jgi:hypothetical protein
MQHDDVEVVHEPFSGPYYHGPERPSRRYASLPPEADQTVSAVASTLAAQGTKLSTQKDV